MSVRTLHRFAATTASVAAAALCLGACGGSEASSATGPTIDLGDSTSTEYRTIPPATTIAPEVVTTDPAGAQQEYTVQAGDYGILVAEKFGVSLTDLENANGWASANNEFPGPGSVIIIPAGATGSATTTADPAETPATDGGDVGPAITAPGSNCGPGKYTIADGDIPLRVANSFDISLEELEAANVGTEGYSSFFVGLEIVIPAAADC